MSDKKLIATIENYEYDGLGFKVILPNVQIIEDRDYTYPQIDMEEVMTNAAVALVYAHKKLDGARLHFIRRFMNKSLDQFAGIIGDISKSTLANWEKDKTKICDLSDQQLRMIYIFLKKEIINKIETSLEVAIVSEFDDEDGEELSPLDMKSKILVA